MPTTANTQAMTNRPIGAESATMARVCVFEPIELLRARYTRQRFAPHTHDEYVFGVIASGAALTFFRGREDVHAAGCVVTFAPGEVHTGAPATEQGWGYRMLYPSQALVRFIAREATGRDFAPVFDTSSVQDPRFAERVRAMHVVLEGHVDRLRKECALLETLGDLVLHHAAAARPGRLTPPPRAPPPPSAESAICSRQNTRARSRSASSPTRRGSARSTSFGCSAPRSGSCRTNTSSRSASNRHVG